MTTSKISPSVQFSLLYGIIASWYGSLLSTCLIRETLPLVCIIWTLLAPVLYIYLMLRITAVERAFITRHRIVFGLALALGIGPVLFLFFLFIRIIFAGI
jgi:hypothetical protein